MEKHIPKIGDGIKGDMWKCGEKLIKDDGFKDADFPGCQFKYIHYVSGAQIAINIKVTGKPKFNGFKYQSRCKIEFVGDGEPSTFSSGVIYHD